jgi:hypothetical protein
VEVAAVEPAEDPVVKPETWSCMAWSTTDPAPSPPTTRSNCRVSSAPERDWQISVPEWTSTALTRVSNAKLARSPCLASRSAISARRMSPREPIQPGRGHSSVPRLGILSPLNGIIVSSNQGPASTWRIAFKPCPEMSIV